MSFQLARPTRSDRVLSQQVEDMLVLLDPESGEYFSLDDVGARIWALCDGTRSVNDIALQLLEEFDAPAEEIEPDTRELIAELTSTKLLREDA